MAKSSTRSYFRLSSTLTYSLLFALPLLLLYEAGAAFLATTEQSTLRNGADVLLRTLFAATGVEGTLAFTAVLVLAAGVFILTERRRRKIPLRGSVFLGMALESIVLALALGVIVGTLTQWVLGSVGFPLSAQTPVESLPLRDAVVLSLGAGIYEELVFRVLLVGGLAGIFHTSGLPRRQAGMFAALLAALLFSAFHYVGPYGDPWEIPSFLFRFLAGLAFSILFLLRGFGITAWTHALYDVFLFLSRG